MASVAVRKTVYDGLTARNQRLLRRARAMLVELGDPNEFVDASGTHWYLWDDPRIDLDMVALLGAITSNWQLLASVNIPNNADDIEQAVRARLGNRLVTPDRVNFSGNDDFQEVLNAQGASAAVRAFAQIPSDWHPV